MNRLFFLVVCLLTSISFCFSQEGKSYVFDQYGVPQVVDILTEAEGIAQYPRLAVANTFTGVNQQTFGGALVAEGNISSGSNATNGVFKSFQSGGSGAYVSLETASGKSGLLRSSNGHFLYYDTSTGDTVMDAVYSTGKLLFKEENTLIGTMATAAASTPGLHLSGTVFTGGSATTTKPMLLVEPTGTTSTAWSTSGTLFGGNAASGFGGNLLDVKTNNSSTARVTISSTGALTSGANVQGLNVIGTTGVYIGSSLDTAFFREAAQLIQVGADSATPTTYTIKGTDSRSGTDTNTAGGHMLIAAGRGTGTAAGGNLILQTSVATTTGTSAGTLSAREFYYGGEKTMTESSATTLVNIAFGTSKYIGGTLVATTHADDATDFQATTEHLTFSAVNKAGTVTATIQGTPSSSTTAASAGTLTTTWTIVNNGASVDIKNNAVSSLTQTTLKVSYKLTLNSDAATTITP